MDSSFKNVIAGSIITVAYLMGMQQPRWRAKK